MKKHIPFMVSEYISERSSHLTERFEEYAFNLINSDSEEVAKANKQKMETVLTDKIQAIVTASQTNDHKTFKALLGKYYLYPKKPITDFYTKSGQWYDGNYPVGCDHYYYTYFHCRPMIEGIFFEDSKNFKNILHSVANSPDCFDVLQEAIQEKETDFNAKYFFSFTDDQSEKVSNILKRMLRDTLKPSDQKYQQMQTLQHTLENKLHDLQTLQKLTPSNANKVAIALAKLDFIETLRQDENFNQIIDTERSHFKSILLNIIIALVTGPIGLIIHRLTTNHWFFKVPTQSRQDITAMKQAMTGTMLKYNEDIEPSQTRASKESLETTTCCEKMQHSS